MLVDTMTHIEKLIEVEKDYRSFSYSRLQRLAADYEKERRKKKIDKAAKFTRTYKLRSPNKNFWLYHFNKDPVFKKYKKVTDCAFTMYTFYINPKGFQVFKIVPTTTGAGIQTITTYNSHVFKRYAERTGADFTQPLKTAQQFFKNNPSSISKGFDKKVIGICSDGLLLGSYLDSNVIFKTFITKEQMKQDQKGEEKEMLEGIESNVIELLNSNTFDLKDRLEYEYTRQILKDLNPKK